MRDERRERGGECREEKTKQKKTECEEEVRQGGVGGRLEGGDTRLDERERGERRGAQWQIS